MKFINEIIRGARVLIKYGSLVMLVLGIVGHAVDALEKWQQENPKLAGEVEPEEVR